jgi:LAO/AO transport system kinase
MELADLVLINKADIDANAAQRAQLQITSALQLLGLFASHADTSWHPKVLQLSALQGRGVDAFWKTVTEFKTLQLANGKWLERRQQQSLAWMWERIDAGLKHGFQQQPLVQQLLPQMKQDVLEGRIAASMAARQLLSAWQTGLDPDVGAVMKATPRSDRDDKNGESNARHT